jgi:hypothetical protein
MNTKRVKKGLAAATGMAIDAWAQAVPVTYYGRLDGASESPPNASNGRGSALVVVDTTAHTLSVSVDFSGLGSNTTVAHIHCCTSTPFTLTAGVATQTPSFVAFPTSVTAGSYAHQFDSTLTSTFNPAFITATGGTAATAEATLAAGIDGGLAYLNIHTTNFGSGEIRSFLFKDKVFDDGFE